MNGENIRFTTKNVFWFEKVRIRAQIQLRKSREILLTWPVTARTAIYGPMIFTARTYGTAFDAGKSITRASGRRVGPWKSRLF
jgi:hypothetical protein